MVKAKAPSQTAMKQVNPNKGNLDRQKAQPILHYMQLIDIHVVSISAIRHPVADQVSDDVPIQIEPSTKMETAYNPKLNTVTAIVVVGVKGKDKDGSQDLFEIKAIYRAVYGISNEFSGDQIEESARSFCRANSLAHVWSYWRELLASTCTRMGLSPIIAPLLIVGAHLPDSQQEP